MRIHAFIFIFGFAFVCGAKTKTMFLFFLIILIIIMPRSFSSDAHVLTHSLSYLLTFYFFLSLQKYKYINKYILKYLFFSFLIYFDLRIYFHRMGLSRGQKRQLKATQTNKKETK